ncbi:alpha/beta hydrolase [Oceanicoccus sagamiensis]|uniref:Dienelactone hydrolase domain-containing protein n=1 Tax=Oceanicoccus sagamiensis TaxID=716816 RepID=A0A1X9NCF0_9GAMM|nr:alpha/beta fold hydrolase [Oceanicoccus sagamiensis]ARN75266.1 hypothetical protein BST96_14775 [Oceanicoccus sagamiensis]
MLVSALLKPLVKLTARLVLLMVFFTVPALSQTGAQIESRLDKVDHKEITLWSEGVRLQGDIYKPKNLQPGDKLPGILLVHGWGGVKQHLQRAYGPQFAELGFIVLAFDYKGWGESDGPLLVPEALQPIEVSADIDLKAKHIRKIVNPLSMVADARAALHYLAGEPQVMSNNIGVWGTSLGGGVALVTSANDNRVKAYVDQIGAVNFKANLDMITDGMVRRWETQRARGKSPNTLALKRRLFPV